MMGMTALFTALIVLVSMAATDTFDVAKTVFIQERRRLLTTTCDYLLELGDLVWIGAGVTTLIHHGLGAGFVLVMVAMALGSFIGAELGDRTSHWVDRRLEVSTNPELPLSSRSTA